MRLGLFIGIYGMLHYGNAAAEHISLSETNSATMVDSMQEMEGKLYCEQPKGFDESIGLPTHGRLRYGVPIYSTTCLDARSPNRYSTQDLADLLNATACHMYELTGARLSIDDVSKWGGGKLKPHTSHQSGLDVDVGHFYAGSRSIKNSTGLISGNSENMAVTWEFVRALEVHPVKVQYIFWSPQHIANLKRYVVHTFGKSEWDRYGSKFYAESRHKRHMHIRIEKPMRGMKIARQVEFRSDPGLD